MRGRSILARRRCTLGRRVRERHADGCLPTYPFQRQRYWVESTAPAAVNGRDRLAKCVYHVQWQPAGATAQARSTGIWLILGDTGNIGAKLAALLEREQQPYRFVSAMS